MRSSTNYFKYLFPNNNKKKQAALELNVFARQKIWAIIVIMLKIRAIEWNTVHVYLPVTQMAAIIQRIFQ